MKTKLIITHDHWLWSLNAYRGPTGEYYVTLANGEGCAVPNGATIGCFESLDWIVLNAAALYLQLVERLNVNIAAKGFVNEGVHGPGV